MRTEDDLRGALQHQADQAGWTAEVSRALVERAVTDQHRQSPLRSRLSIAVAVAVVAALIAVPLAVRRTVTNSTVPRPAAPSPATEPALSWVTATNSDYRFGRTMTVGSNREYIQVETHDFSEWALVDFAPGTFDTSILAHASPVTVDGHAGYYAKATRPAPRPDLPNLMSPLVNGSFAHGNGYLSTIAWQVGPGHWVMLDRFSAPSGSPSASEAELVAFASTLHLKVRDQPVRQVFRIGYLPGTGWKLKSVSISDLGDLPLDSLREAVLVKGKLTVQVWVTRHLPNLPINGLHRTVGDYDIEVNRDAALAGTNPLDAATTKRILDSIKLATHPVSEDGSWFPISALLP